MVSRGGAEEGRAVVFNGYRVPDLQDENVLENSFTVM